MNTYNTIAEAMEARQAHPKCADIVCAIEVELAGGGNAIILSLTYIDTLRILLSRKPMPEIKKLIRQIEDFKADEKAAKEKAGIVRAEKIKTLFPGLKEIERARNYEEEDRRRFERMMERGDGYYKSCKPEISSDALRKQYPAAAAYLRAQAYTRSNNIGKYSAGAKAIERLMAGENYKTVIADMEREWSAYVSAHID